MFKTKEEHSEQPVSAAILRERDLILSPLEELNWSDKGEHVEFGINEIVPLKPLDAIGHCGSALVDSVLCRRIKLERKTMICSRKQKLETIINEVEQLQRLRHPHIIQLVGSYLQGKKFAILLYPVAQWNLARFLEHIQEADTAKEMMILVEPQLRALSRFFQCLADALAYIHANTRKHMDIKPQNVLVRTDNKNHSQFKVYLYDFFPYRIAGNC